MWMSLVNRKWKLIGPSAHHFSFPGTLIFGTGNDSHAGHGSDTAIASAANVSFPKITHLNLEEIGPSAHFLLNLRCWR